jgi:uncharacterized protein
MIEDSENQNRPRIDYPCEWEYKIIGENVDKILLAIETASLGLEYTVSPSNLSRNGKYCSLNMRLMVPNEVVRDLVYEKLSSSESVRFVI